MMMLDRQQIPEYLLRHLGERDIEFFNAIDILDGLSLIKKIEMIDLRYIV
jgi:hypothetical protein